ncbi:MAG TPA: OmpA family protein [Mariprofundaceae bacterium]|nr:OmpA family protein [Mariprofundaceae bacterium]
MARRRSRKQESDEGGGNFELLFLQLMMVMLAFFILLSSLAVVVDQKRLKAINSLSGAFSFLPAGGNVNKGKGPSMPTPSLGGSGAASKRTAKDLTEVAKLLGLGDAVHVLPLDKQTVRVRLPEKILFHSGGVKLDPTMRPFLDIMADILRRPEVIEITIQGYTDEIPIKGSRYASNWELSAARAMQVFLALEKRGVPRGRMIVAGMGSNHPLPESETHGDRSLNRRVDILLKFRPVTDKGESSMMGAPAEHGQAPRSAVKAN